jgi:hypothetical protein
MTLTFNAQSHRERSMHHLEESDYNIHGEGARNIKVLEVCIQQGEGVLATPPTALDPISTLGDASWPLNEQGVFFFYGQERKTHTHTNENT